MKTQHKNIIPDPLFEYNPSIIAELFIRRNNNNHGRNGNDKIRSPSSFIMIVFACNTKDILQNTFYMYIKHSDLSSFQIHDSHTKAVNMYP